MIHKSQKPIKYYFLKDISRFNCTENLTKETAIYFYFFVTFIHIFN